ncbi:MAG: error-prone DNA polymerase [bacterium]|nr:error-prone DNA polymerase [bacterium]
MTSYVPLWCKSNYSFLEGASHPDELVEQVQQHGLDALALTDRDGVYGIVRAHARATQLGVKLLLGAEVSVGTDPDDRRSLVLLATDRAGYGNLCRLLTVGRRRCVKGSSVVYESELLDHAPGLLALWHGDFAAPERLCDAFGDRLYALVTRHRRATEVADEARIRTAAKRLGLPVVAGVEVLYHSRARRPLQDVLTCIRHGVNVHTAGTHTRPNAEHALLQPAAMARLFEDDPAALARTLEVAARCTFSLAELRYRYPDERLPDGRSSMQWLRQLTMDGARRRYEGAPPVKVREQLDKELGLIEELEYPGYFLTMREIVRYCDEHGILCQGRGSAANSAVCYCLGITAVDPVQMNLLFERFLSRERAEPPDIDLDIAHERREEVLQHVYDKYGRSHAAMVANVIRYRTRSAIRDVGKALDLPATSLDRLAKLSSRWGHEGGDGESGWSATLRQAGLDPDTPVHLHLVQLVHEIQDFPRHLSIHPGGFLLGHEPVDSIVPIENGTMADRTVIQWDKDDIENLGLFKVDCLGLGALSLVDRAFALLRRHRGVEMSLATVPEEDPATYAMICRGDTVGVFQIESRAQMAMLPRLRPRTFYDLVIEVSIVRPGPIAGDMVHPYLRRRHGKEPVTYAHESLRPVLEKTLGVPLFQEQVMKLAMVAADYTPGEADQLRRDMAAWRSSGRIDRHREVLVERMCRKGIAAEFAERVFEQIRGFGEYGFPESHAASFALIAYVTSWLKCHHPDVFACALLNAQPMGFYSPATIVEDAKRHGVLVRPVDVCASTGDCTLEDSGEAALALRMGLRYVNGLGTEPLERIVTARSERPFASLEDFRRRTGLQQKHLAVLAEIGALETLREGRREALWSVWKPAVEADELGLVDREATPVFAPLDVLEAVTWDYRAGSHSARSHPLEPLRDQLRRQRLREALDVSRLKNGVNTQTAGLVICRQRPGTAGGVVFLTLEDETGFVNVVVWDRVFEQFAALIKTATFLAVAGKVQHEDGVVHVVARRFWVPAVELAPESGGSRDFH